MIKRFLLSVSLLCSLVSTQVNATPILGDYQVYYLNGMRDYLNTTGADLIASDLLPGLACCGANLSGLVVQLDGRNPSVEIGMFKLINDYLAQGDADRSRNSVKKNWLTFWKSMNCPDTSQVINNPCANIIQKTLAQYDEVAYVTQPNLQAMVKILQDNFKNPTSNKKMLLIAHGQGNYYANQLWNYLHLHNPDIAACTGVVGIGTPATYVANNGLYTTNDLDNMINLLRRVASWGGDIRPANYPLPLTWLSHDISGHDLSYTYIYNSGTNAQIRSQIASVVNQVNTNCVLPTPPPTPPVPKCEDHSASGNGSGLSDGQVISQVLGPGRHTITMTFSQDPSRYTNAFVSISGSGMQTLSGQVFEDFSSVAFTEDSGSQNGYFSINVSQKSLFNWWMSTHCN